MSQERKPTITLKKLQTSLEEKPHMTTHYFDMMSHELDLIVAGIEGHNNVLEFSLSFLKKIYPHKVKSTENQIEANKRIIKKIQGLK